MKALEPVALIVGLTVGVIAVSAVARVLDAPAPILLVAAGVAASFTPGLPDLRLDPELVLVVLLPPLLYAAALGSSLIDIRENVRAIGLLAVGLVLATTLVVGFALHAAVPSVPLWAAIALGAIVAPPDAVAATAVARRAGLARRTLTVLEGESLFNDATALVSLRVAVAAVAGTFGVVNAGGQFVLASAGGIGVGLVVGWLLVRVRRHVVDARTDAAVSLVAPFIAFLPAEAIHASGVIAVVVAGLLVAHWSPVDQEPRARLVETSTWSTVQFVLEGAVFALIGLELRTIIEGISSTPGDLVIAVAVVLAAVVLVRPAWILGFAYVGRFTPWEQRRPTDLRQLAALSWAGMRGVVSLAAALSLPFDFPHRDLLLAVTVAVIVGTLGLQGSTLPWLIRRLGIQPPDPRRDTLQRALAQERAADAATNRLNELIALEHPPPEIVERLQRLASLRAWIAWERLGDWSGGEPPTATYRRLRQEMIVAERQVLVGLRDGGEIDDELLRQVQRELDLEETLLADDGAGEVDPGGMLEQLMPASPGTCIHLREAPDLPATPVEGCQECLALGMTWVHLRRCLACGHIGCCDSSVGHHATNHFEASHHAVMRSAEPGESWRWCYVDRILG